MLPTDPTKETFIAVVPLSEQRRLLREQLQTQREEISAQLDPARGDQGQSGYPRSATMRLLTEHSALVGGLFTGAASLLVGARYFKTITAALTTFKLVRTAMANRRS